MLLCVVYAVKMLSIGIYLFKFVFSLLAFFRFFHSHTCWLVRDCVATVHVFVHYLLSQTLCVCFDSYEFVERCCVCRRYFATVTCCVRPSILAWMLVHTRGKDGKKVFAMAFLRILIYIVLTVSTTKTFPLG